MSNQPSGGWRNWGDHPVVVVVGLIVATITITVFITGKQRIQDFIPQPTPTTTPIPINTELLRHLNKAKEYMDQEKYSEAISEYNIVLLIDTSNSIAYNNRGFSYLKIESYDEAMDDFNHAIGIDPNNYVFFRNRGYTYLTRKDYNAAINEYDHAIQLTQSDPILYNDRASAYASLGDIDNAIKDYRQCSTIANDKNVRNGCDTLEVELLKIRLSK